MFEKMLAVVAFNALNKDHEASKEKLRNVFAGGADKIDLDALAAEYVALTN